MIDFYWAIYSDPFLWVQFCIIFVFSTGLLFLGFRTNSLNWRQDLFSSTVLGLGFSLFLVAIPVLILIVAVSLMIWVFVMSFKCIKGDCNVG